MAKTKKKAPKAGSKKIPKKKGKRQLISVTSVKRAGGLHDPA